MIYIATHHRVINFGAALQSYALQQYLNSLGYENELLLVDEEKKEKKTKTTRNIVRLCYKYFQKAYKKLHCKEIKRCEENFNDFFENYHKKSCLWNFRFRRCHEMTY